MSDRSLRSQLSFVSVIAANLLSLAVFWWAGWQAHALLVVYWLETGVILWSYRAKILRAAGTDDPDEIRAWTTIDGERAEWYIGKDNGTVASALGTHFLRPWLAWGVIVLAFGFVEPFEPANPVVVALAAVGLVASHGFSFRYEYVRAEEFERRGPVSLLVEPAARVWSLVLLIFLGIGATLFFTDTAGVIAALVVFKTAADLAVHRRERKRATA